MDHLLTTRIRIERRKSSENRKIYRNLHTLPEGGCVLVLLIEIFVFTEILILGLNLIELLLIGFQHLAVQLTASFCSDRMEDIRILGLAVLLERVLRHLHEHPFCESMTRRP